MFFFTADFWLTVIILTLIGFFSSDKIKIKDARYKKGHREVDDNSKGIRQKFRESFIGAVILATIGFAVYHYYIKN